MRNETVPPRLVRVPGEDQPRLHLEANRDRVSRLVLGYSGGSRHSVRGNESPTMTRVNFLTLLIAATGLYTVKEGHASDRETTISEPTRERDGILVHTIESPYQAGKTEL